MLMHSDLLLVLSKGLGIHLTSQALLDFPLPLTPLIATYL